MHGTNAADSGIATRPDRKASAKTVVWDIGVRGFHWSLVVVVATAAATGFLAPEWWLDIHVWAGYAVGILIVFRVVWAFYGSFHARLSSFLFSPNDTLRYLRALLRGKPQHFTGHNPAGALMVFALFVLLSALLVSGLMVLGGQENQGMLSGIVAYDAGHGARVFHELLSILLLFLIGAHILGVVAESLLCKENLAGAMLTGRKNRRSASTHPVPGTASPRRALLAIAVIAAAGGTAISALARMPASGLVEMPGNAVYLAECGDCHHAYHPSLLPASSWRRIMTGLPDHFGEDASLGRQTARELATYLAAYAAERWDTEAANNLRRVAARDPLRITAAPYWTARHKDIAKAVFAGKTIGSKGNCIACHADAATGRFDDQMIAVPEKQISQKATWRQQ